MDLTKLTSHDWVIVVHTIALLIGAIFYFLLYRKQKEYSGISDATNILLNKHIETVNGLYNPQTFKEALDYHLLIRRSEMDKEAVEKYLQENGTIPASETIELVEKVSIFYIRMYDNADEELKKKMLSEFDSSLFPKSGKHVKKYISIYLKEYSASIPKKA